MTHLFHKPEKIDYEKRGMVHFILFHSYLIFFIAIVLGVILDTFLKDKMFSGNIYSYIGFTMVMIGSIIIYWAQKTSSNYKQKTKKNESMSQFEFGPYKYLRHPTHLGLLIMTFGFSLMINSFFGIILVILAYIYTRLFSIKKQEKILEKKHGEIYSSYKKKVKDWI